MIYFIALIPATALSFAGYFVLYLSNRSEGTFQKFGKYLGFWAFTLAALVVLGAIFAAAHGARHGGMNGMRGMHERMHGPWPGDPRCFGPRDEESRDAGPPGPPGAPNPSTPPAPASPSAR
jgi:hypothetical protein